MHVKGTIETYVFKQEGAHVESSRTESKLTNAFIIDATLMKSFPYLSNISYVTIKRAIQSSLNKRKQ